MIYYETECVTEATCQVIAASTDVYHCTEGYTGDGSVWAQGGQASNTPEVQFVWKYTKILAGYNLKKWIYRCASVSS